jgi:hypothetical protein
MKYIGDGPSLILKKKTRTEGERLSRAALTSRREFCVEENLSWISRGIQGPVEARGFQHIAESDLYREIREGGWLAGRKNKPEIVGIVQALRGMATP